MTRDVTTEDPTARHGQASVALRINGELCYTESEVPADAVFPIYSISKTFTAICVLRLVEMNLLDLVSSIRRWLPETGIPDDITLEHLLRHRSGLSDYGPLPEYHAAVRAHPSHPWTRQQFLDATLRQGLLFPAGTHFSYSNIGYMLAADIIERATGQTFGDVLHEVLEAPLSLHNTSVLETLDQFQLCVPGFGPEVTPDEQVVDVRSRYHPGWCAPRLVRSTAEDVTRVFDSLVAGRILRPDTLQHMLHMRTLSDDASDVHSSGMGLFSDRLSRGGPNYQHLGGGPGYNGAAIVCPDTSLGRLSIAVFVNSSCGARALDRQIAIVNQLLEL
jgi:D-alanyl-D-alanine carboxypeptidase